MDMPSKHTANHAEHVHTFDPWLDVALRPAAALSTPAQTSFPSYSLCIGGWGVRPVIVGRLRREVRDSRIGARVEGFTVVYPLFVPNVSLVMKCDSERKLLQVGCGLLCDLTCPEPEG